MKESCNKGHLAGKIIFLGFFLTLSGLSGCGGGGKGSEAPPKPAAEAEGKGAHKQRIHRQHGVNPRFFQLFQ